MATVKALVLKHNEKSDGTFNVKIRITHKRVSRYLDTDHFVSQKQLNKKNAIKDNIIILQVDKTVNKHRRSIGELDGRIDQMTCDQIVDFVKNNKKEIDFIEFSRAHVNRLKLEKNKGTSNFRAVINSLVDYFGRERIYISEITTNMLRQYEQYLLKPRKLVRQSRGEKLSIKISPGLSSSGLHNHMRDLRSLFNVARDTFNDEDLGIIRIVHYPFKKYKIVKRPETPKKNLDVDQVLTIRDHECAPGSMKELASELFMLSFYTCGTNSVDFYQMDETNIRNGRLEYMRSKTEGKRIDRAFISIKIIDEAKPLVEKYIGKLQHRFATSVGLSTALSNGMRKIREDEGLPKVTFYWARSIVATWARNKCRKSKDDIAMMLNHVDEGRKTTDIYIEKDWSIIDEVQEAVTLIIRHLKKKDKQERLNPAVSFMSSINLMPLSREKEKPLAIC
ncbi:phage integrase SAM-like domain-containing protein [Mucilaginibacter sp. dw_454]|uniref:phage integrase SAM-like domain-containing protein n=1 Tax=Mucilaginibacter sp. dw_454 TaxID=2720079 RepID=UPI001BD3E11B|nr:phage integrase SAM-like domain-containing protein [Mucilaginibacter sp. dw_454]